MKTYRKLNYLLRVTFAVAPALILATPVSSQSGCHAECPAPADCAGSCLIEAPEDSTCSAVCTAGCSAARCQLFGGPECIEADETACERRPGKRRSGQPLPSPLETPWAVLEIDQAGEFSSAARGVLAASTAEFGKEALASFWVAERERQTRDRFVPAVLTVFRVAPVGNEPVAPQFRLGEPGARPGLPAATRFFFRAATDGTGRVVAVEALYTTAEDAIPSFIGFIKDHYRVESESIPGAPIFFHGRITVDSGGRLIRTANAPTLLSAADLELFRQLAE